MPSTSEAEFLVEGQDENVSRRRKQILVGGVAVIVSVALVVILVMIFAVEPSKKKINVIMMVSDGWGPAAATLARTYSKRALYIDPYLVGTVRTLSADSLVTDSAAGATAYSCGVHTYNGGIGIDANKKACGTVLEAASQKGMRTGVVTTTRVTDATPASFISHSSDRDYEDFIATQVIDQVGFQKHADVIFGGGRAHFDPSFREDKQDLLSYAREHDFTIVQTKTEMEQVSPGKKVLGLFADYNMAYAIDRVNNASLSSQPSLLEMTKKALELLENDNGFFVMLEGALIDVAEHVNDAASCVNEVIGYDETFAYVIQYAQEHGNTVVISTSDHETGGLTLGLQLNFTPDAYPDYAYYPEKLYGFNTSCDTMAINILAGGDARSIISSGTNITDLSDEEIAFITQYSDYREMSGAIGNTVSKRSLIGWTTHGHTGVDVNLYAFNLPDDLHVEANHENIDIAAFIADMLELDLEALTNQKELSQFDTTPVNPVRQVRRDADHRHRKH